MEQTVEVDVAAAVATVWLNRAQRRNALDAETVAGLDAALARIEAEDGLRVVVLAGRGRHFCAGADLDAMVAMADAPESVNREDALRLAGLLRRLALLRQPTIARVHGVAAGGGVGLAAACDLCIATEAAAFVLPEVRLGLVPAVISPYVVRAVGVRQALPLMLGGERIDAATACRLGLAHEVCGADAIDARIAHWCGVFAAGAPRAQARVKELVARVSGQPLSDALLDLTARALAEVRTAEEARSGLRAQRDGVAPPWIRN